MEKLRRENGESMLILVLLDYLSRTAGTGRIGR